MNEWRVSRWINALVLINLTSANMRSHYALWLNTISYLKFPLWYRWDVPYTFMLQPTGIKGEIKCPHLTGADENSIVIWGQLFKNKKKYPQVQSEKDYVSTTAITSESVSVFRKD